MPQCALAIVETGLAVSRGPRAAPKRASRAALVVTVSRRAIAVALSAITVLRGARCPVALLRETFTGPAVATVAHRIGFTFLVIGHLFAVIVAPEVRLAVLAAYERIRTSPRDRSSVAYASANPYQPS